MTTTPASGAAVRAIENCPELNMGNYDEVDVERLNDWAIRAYDEIRRLHTESEMRRVALLDEMQKAALAAGQAVVQDGVAALVRAAQAFVLEPDSHKKRLELEAMAWGPLAAATQPEPVPVLWVSPEQFANFMDADEAQFGRYVPARKTSAGNFTMPLFAVRAPAPEQPAAQQPHGAAYAALPTHSHAGSFLIGTCPLYTADQMRAFADATHTLRASHWQAPASTSGDFIRRTNEDYAAWCATKYTPEFNSKGPDLHGLWAWQEQQRRMDDLLRQAPAQAAAPAQAGEYPALVCDYCGALTPDPWHSSGMLHGKMSKHIHSCDACAARGAAKAQAAKQQEQLI